jgi:ArsR family metal-binding transcriptional regulator
VRRRSRNGASFGGLTNERWNRMLIDDYETALSTPACDLESPVYAAKVTLKVDISEVLPYVNASVERGEFIPGIPVLVWTEGGRKYALRDREMAISGILDRDEADNLVSALVAKVNDIWERREGLEPSYATVEKPKVLDIFKLLPRTNCKQCGAPTCMAFADMIAKDKKTLDECPPLLEPDREVQLTSLKDMGL